MRYTIKKFCIDTTRIIYLIINLNLALLNDKHNKKLFFKRYDKIIFTLDFFYLRFLIYYSNLIYSLLMCLASLLARASMVRTGGAPGERGKTLASHT